ncbi:MAG: hypothetical protein K2J31_03730, partial [Alistipes sp.]|nr:hypothetical protein [Alistipes sp.]
ISPEGSDRLVVGTSYAIDCDMAKKYCFRYLYDGMGNVCKAYIPGRDEPDITNYDSFNRPLSSSTAAMRSEDCRYVYKYDGLGRVTAVRTSRTAAPTAQYDSKVYIYDNYSTASEWISHGFTAVEGIVGQSDILTVPRSMKTHERVYEVYDNSDPTAARSSRRTFYYDVRGRIVQTVETSPMGRTVRVSCKYDYTGNPLIRHEQYTIGSVTTTVVYTYAYDSRGRVTAETTAVDGEQITDIAYSYDELGQLKTVKAGADIETSYTYNIQGWLTRKSTNTNPLKPRLASVDSGLIIDRDSLIMPPGGIAESLQKNIFEQTLEYFSPKHAQPRYAGNIAETSWKRGREAADTYVYT